MDAGARPDFIHRVLAETFAELGATGPMVRTFLLRDRYFAGQKFHCGGFQAVLPAGKDEVEFYDQAGALVKTVRVRSTEEQKAA